MLAAAESTSSRVVRFAQASKMLELEVVGKKIFQHCLNFLVFLEICLDQIALLD